MADTEQRTRTIPAEVMARHYQEKANLVEGMSITRLANQVEQEAEVVHCHAIIARLKADLQTANETIAQRDAEITRLDAGREPLTAHDLGHVPDTQE